MSNPWVLPPACALERRRTSIRPPYLVRPLRGSARLSRPRLLVTLPKVRFRRRTGRSHAPRAHAGGAGRLPRRCHRAGANFVLRAAWVVTVNLARSCWWSWTGFGRVYLDVHYLSSALRGFVAKGAWLSAVIAGLEDAMSASRVPCALEAAERRVMRLRRLRQGCRLNRHE